MRPRKLRGDRLEIFADDWAIVQEMIDERRRRESNKPIQATRPNPFVRLGFNRTGADLDRGHVVGIAGVAAFDGTTMKDSVKTDPRLSFEGVTTADTMTNNVAIVTRPAIDDGSVEAVVGGVVFALVDITDAGHGYARPVDGSDTLTSSGMGLWRIIDRESGLGVKSAIVELRACPPPFKVILSAGMKQRSGATAGVWSDCEIIQDDAGLKLSAEVVDVYTWAVDEVNPDGDRIATASLHDDGKVWIHGFECDGDDAETTVFGPIGAGL